MYDVQTLHSKCAAYLKKNICDDNVVDIWIEADRCQDSDLMECALKYLANKSGEIANVPGMEEAFQSPKFMKQLSVFLASHCNHFVIEGTDKQITVKFEADRYPDLDLTLTSYQDLALKHLANLSGEIANVPG